MLSLSENFKVENITYDKNGNLITLERNNNVGTQEDNLNYNYKVDDDGDRLNQLDHVTGVYQSSQSADNYGYDDSGRLIRDNVQEIKYIYNVQGLVTKITDFSDVPIVEYVYDDGGFRYKKKNYTGGVLTKTTLYIRDISGQIASIYEKTTGTYSLEEVPFYGSSRLGSIQDGNKYIDELKDHLGNVRQTIRTTNGVPPVDTASTKWAYTKANYYPFGLKFDDINGSSADYRYGYQGEYAEDEGTEAGIQTNSFQLRLYNPRLGRWLSPDPFSLNYPQYSPYIGMANNPILYVDGDGRDFITFGAALQTEILGILSKTFGSSHGFSFKGNQLVYNGSYHGQQIGNMKNLEAQKWLHTMFIDNIVNNKSVVYEHKGFNLTQVILPGQKKPIPIPAKYAGTFNNWSNGILNSFTAVGKDYKNAIYDEEGVKSTKESLFWHEISHPISRNLAKNAPSITELMMDQFTVGFENFVRQNILFMHLRNGLGHKNPGSINVGPITTSTYNPGSLNLPNNWSNFKDDH